MTVQRPLPARAGTSFKPEHAATILTERPDIGWFEIHPENYMGAGGPPHRMLAELCAGWPVSMHGVGLSLGGPERPDPDHLRRLRDLVRRYRPACVSEHLAWSGHGGIFLNDLLPLPYDGPALARLAAHVDEVQEALQRPILLENPSRYLAFDSSTLDEAQFLDAVAAQTGCGLLLDINNVFVSGTNLGFDPATYLAAFPMARVAEIHLAGHATDPEEGAALLIDAHDRAVDAAVWKLHESVIARCGPVATLVEWDNDLPPWPVLQAEARKADRILQGGGHRAAAE